eukprot:1339485-Amorphochlora_amoeboformis.AAC.1
MTHTSYEIVSTHDGIKVHVRSTHGGIKVHAHTTTNVYDTSCSYRYTGITPRMRMPSESQPSKYSLIQESWGEMYRY